MLLTQHFFQKGTKSEQGPECHVSIQRAQHTRLLLEIISQVPGSIQPGEDAESNCHKENKAARAGWLPERSRCKFKTALLRPLLHCVQAFRLQKQGGSFV